MAKVKKRAGVTGVRNAKSSKKARPASLGKTSRAATRKATGAGTRASKKQAARSARAAADKRGTKAKRSTGTRTATAEPSSRMTTTKARASTKLTVTRGTGRRATSAPEAPAPKVSVRELDPQRKCGPGTSVQFLYRVDIVEERASAAHLVFFDRHGWYCEHGRTCPAVAYARKYNGRIARVS